MNVERLKTVAQAVVADNKRVNLVNVLQTLENAYTQSFQSPSPENAEAFDAALQNLLKATKESECAKLTSSGRQLLNEIGGSELCGPGLGDKIETLIRSAITPSAAVEELQKLRSDVEEFQSTVERLDRALSSLKIAPEPLPADRAEVEVIFPKQLVEGEFRRFVKEADKLERALADITEVATGEREPISLVGLGSSNLQVYVNVNLVAGAALITFITAIVQLINSILQTRKARMDLQTQNAPTTILNELKEWEKQRIEEELKRLGDELITHYEGQASRKHELRNALTTSLKYLADRIDRGMDVDVVVPPPIPSSDAEGTPSEPASAQQEQRAAIRAHSGVIARLERSQEPVLLLPESADEDFTEEESAEDESKERPAKKKR